MKDLKLKALQLGAAAMLTRNQLKDVKGGAAADCRLVGEPCTGDVQCCSNTCIDSADPVTGAVCGVTP